MSHITVVGNLTKDPEISFTKTDGKPFIRFGIAENHRKKDGNEWKDDGVTFYNVTSFAANVESLVDAIKIGSTVKIEGTLRSRAWGDSGEKVSLDVLADNLDGVTLIVRAARRPTQDESPF